LGEKIEIYKFKVTIFMAIIAAVGFMVVNSEKFLKFINIWIYTTIIFIISIYGVIGFVFNMLKLSKLEKELDKCQN